MSFTKGFREYACVGDSISCTVDGFDVTARIEYDEQHNIDDDDSHNAGRTVTGCNDAQQATLLAARAAWLADEWQYVGVVLSVSKNGVRLCDHAASLWGLECNYPGGDNAYLLEVANELLPEAIEEAKRTLAKLCE